MQNQNLNRSCKICKRAIACQEQICEKGNSTLSSIIDCKTLNYDPYHQAEINSSILFLMDE